MLVRETYIKICWKCRIFCDNAGKIELMIYMRNIEGICIYKVLPENPMEGIMLRCMLPCDRGPECIPANI